MYNIFKVYTYNSSAVTGVWFCLVSIKKYESGEREMVSYMHWHPPEYI